MRAQQRSAASAPQGVRSLRVMWLASLPPSAGAKRGLSASAFRPSAEALSPRKRAGVPLRAGARLYDVDVLPPERVEGKVAWWGCGRQQAA